ncbi:MAG: hypothetical protein HC854_16035 [Flavobacterium sp.]|nr:hypothetical protein [Flavobacterium sp.]
MCELLRSKNFNINDVNNLLLEENASFKFIFESNYGVDVYPISKIEENSENSSHTNIKLLVNRLENAYQEKDYPSVLHTCSNIFETLAKDILGTKSSQNGTFEKIFSAYLTKTLLPEEISNYMLSIYRKRNKEPLAGHGSTKTPTIDREKATILKELTKAFINIEYYLQFENNLNT